MNISPFRRAAARVALGFAFASSAPAAPASALAPVTAEHHVAVKDVCAWPMLVTLRDGTIVAITHNQPSHGQREGEVEAWATQDGVKWTKRGHPAPHDPRTVRMNVGAGLARNGDFLGYPSTAQLADGTLVTIWYEAPGTSHRAQLRQAKWRLDR